MNVFCYVIESKDVYRATVVSGRAVKVVCRADVCFTIPKVKQ